MFIFNDSHDLSSLFKLKKNFPILMKFKIIFSEVKIILLIRWKLIDVQIKKVLCVNQNVETIFEYI